MELPQSTIFEVIGLSQSNFLILSMNPVDESESSDSESLELLELDESPEVLFPLSLEPLLTLSLGSGSDDKKSLDKSSLSNSSILSL